MTKQEIYDLMNQNLGFFLATSEDDQPHVRGMMLFRANENGIIFHTASTLWCEILLLLGKALRKVFSRETR